MNTTHFDLLEFDTELDFSNKIGYDNNVIGPHRRAKHVKICMYVCMSVCEFDTNFTYSDSDPL